MDYICGHYWNRESEVALVLKQLAFHEGNQQVVFACLAEGESRQHFVEEMTDWLLEKAVKHCKRGEKAMDALERSLEKQLQKHAGNGENLVLLCVGNFFFLWGRGRQKAWILNARFGKSCGHLLLGEKERKRGELLHGEVEKGVGILLTTGEFGEFVSEEQLVECLAVKTLDKESKVEKHLKELGDENVRKGKKHGTAVLVVTC